MSSEVFRILIADNVSPECRALFAGDPRFEVVEDKLRGEDFLEAIGGFHGLIVRSGCKVPAEAFPKATKLRAIVRAGVGVDNIDLEAATRHGVLVMNTPEGNTISAAEHSIAMMMALSRNIAAADAAVRKGQWRSPAFLGAELRDKTIGVIGLGKIGREVARRALGLDMTVIGFDPVLTEESARALRIELCELDALFERADYLSVHVPMTPKTRGLINKDTLARMKPTARIINCARGGIVDEAALVEALREGRIAGAALDVFETEPLPADSPLLTQDKLVLTPHLGASTLEAQETVGIMSGRQLKAFLLDGEIRNAVNTLALDAHELNHLEPYLILARRLGSLHAQLLDGELKRFQVTAAGPAFEGDDAKGSNARLRVLTLSALEGFFSHYLSAPVNRVSVPHFAREHGIAIAESSSNDAQGYANLLVVQLETSAGERTVAGALFGKRNARLVMIDDYSLDALPEGRALIFKNYDRPGMLGRVTSILGGAGVNIANVNLGRDESGGTALAFLNLDSEPSGETIQELQAIDGIPWVRVVDLT